MEWIDANWGLKNVISRCTKKYFDDYKKKPLLHWPAKSPDLSVLDYSIWARLKFRAIEHSKNGFYENKEEAKACLVKAWSELDQSYIG